MVAGGSGVRMGGGIPKQFLPLLGKPVLMHTLEKFQGLVDDIILVLPAEHFAFWKELCDEHSFLLKPLLVQGGSTRTQSVINGLNATSAPGIVAIHDAVRPLVSRSLISVLLQSAIIRGNAVPVIPVRESLRSVNALLNTAVNRDEFVMVQTPQCFDLELIKAAYVKNSDQYFSDDASVLEFSGSKIHLEEGEISNIKITFKEDFLFAEALLQSNISG